MVNFSHTVGAYFDNHCQGLGLRQTVLRHQPTGTVIEPRPMLYHQGPTATSDLNFQNSESETLDAWTTTIPRETLIKCLGATMLDLIQPDTLWEIDSTNTGNWKLYRAYGVPLFNDHDASDRVQLTFRADICKDDYLSFESPYLP